MAFCRFHLEADVQAASQRGTRFTSFRVVRFALQAALWRSSSVTDGVTRDFRSKRRRNSYLIMSMYRETVLCRDWLGSKTLPSGPARIAGSNISSAITPATRMVNINQPNLWVGVNVLNAKTDNPSPLMHAACSVGVAHRL